MIYKRNINAVKKCKYCERELKPKGESHEAYCYLNPNRTIVDRSGEKSPMFGKKGANQYSKGRKNGTDVNMAEETRIRISESAKKRSHTELSKLKISESMKKVVLEKPEVYSGSNVNGRTKKINYNGTILDSSWELYFARWCDFENIKWEKNKKGFNYEWNGERIYYPDFYLEDFDLYVEVKGYERERDKEKWKSVQNLLVIKKKEIKEIKEGVFKIMRP